MEEREEEGDSLSLAPLPLPHTPHTPHTRFSHVRLSRHDRLAYSAALCVVGGVLGLLANGYGEETTATTTDSTVCSWTVAAASAQG